MSEPECVSAGDMIMSGGGIVVMWWSPTHTISYTGNIHNLKNNFHEMFYWYLKQRYIFSTIILTRMAVVVLGLDE